MKKGVLAGVGAIIWLGLTYLVVVYLLDQNLSKNCYIQTREIIYEFKPWVLDDPSPNYGQAKLVQRNLNASIEAFGFLSDSAISRVLKDEMLSRYVLLKADSTYYEVLCKSGIDGGVDSYIATPDTIYTLEYRPIIVIEKSRPD